MPVVSTIVGPTTIALRNDDDALFAPEERASAKETNSEAILESFSSTGIDIPTKHITGFDEVPNKEAARKLIAFDAVIADVEGCTMVAKVGSMATLVKLVAGHLAILITNAKTANETTYTIDTNSINEDSEAPAILIPFSIR